MWCVECYDSLVWGDWARLTCHFLIYLPPPPTTGAVQDTRGREGEVVTTGELCHWEGLVIFCPCRWDLNRPLETRSSRRVKRDCATPVQFSITPLPHLLHPPYCNTNIISIIPMTIQYNIDKGFEFSEFPVLVVVISVLWRWRWWWSGVMQSWPYKQML